MNILYVYVMNVIIKTIQGELTNSSELIEKFNLKEDDKERVLCFKNNTFIGNYNINEASLLFKAGQKNIINCCEGKTKTAGGCVWKYAKKGQKIEKFTPYKAPSNVKEYLNLVLGKYSDVNLLTEKQLSGVITIWELSIIKNLFCFTIISMNQKIELVRIVNKLEKCKE